MEKLKNVYQSLIYTIRCDRAYSIALADTSKSVSIFSDVDNDVCIKYYMESGMMKQCVYFNCCRRQDCAYYTRMQKCDDAERKYLEAKKQLGNSIKDLFHFKRK